jgi:hypothetical protein
MKKNAASTWERITVSMLLGLVALVALSFVSLCFLDQVKRLDYANSVNALVLCGLTAVAVFSAIAFYYSLKARVTSESEGRFANIAGWASLLLSIEALIESTLLPRGDISWFRFPAQIVIGGLLGISVAVLKHKWGWSVWGIVTSLFGSWWVATILFWAH